MHEPMLAACRALTPLLGLALLSTVASAQVAETTYGPKQEEYLISFNLSYSYADLDGTAIETAIGVVGLGYFLTRAHELGVDVAGSHGAVEAGGDAHTFFIGPYYNYNWYATPRTSFYAGGRLGLELADATGISSQTGYSYGLQVGMRQWLTERVSFNVEPRWDHTEFDEYADNRDEFGVFLGFNVVL